MKLNLKVEGPGIGLGGMGGLGGEKVLVEEVVGSDELSVSHPSLPRQHLPQTSVAQDSVLLQVRRGEDHTRRKDE